MRGSAVEANKMGRTMVSEAIQRGSEVFVHDGDKAVSTVRDVKPAGDCRLCQRTPVISFIFFGGEQACVWKAL
jgi:hypothetical protein